MKRISSASLKLCHCVLLNGFETSCSYLTQNMESSWLYMLNVDINLHEINSESCSSFQTDWFYLNLVTLHAFQEMINH